MRSPTWTRNSNQAEVPRNRATVQLTGIHRTVKAVKMGRAIAKAKVKVKVKVKDSNDEGKAVLDQRKDKAGSNVHKAKEASNAPAKAVHNVHKAVNNVQHKGKAANNVLRDKARAATVQRKGTSSVPEAKAVTVRRKETNNSAPARGQSPGTRPEPSRRPRWTSTGERHQPRA